LPLTTGTWSENAVEHGFDVRGHVVWPLDLVHPAGLRRGDAFERGDEIGAHVRIGVLLNHQRRRGVPQKDKHGAVARFDLVEEARPRR
jgi:hypothetical protein